MWECHGDRRWVWQLGLVSCAACSNRLEASFGLVSLARNSRSFSSLISLQYLAVPLQIPRWGHAVPLVKPIQISTHPACRSPFYNQYTKDGDEPQHWIYTVCEHCLQLLWETTELWRSVSPANCVIALSFGRDSVLWTRVWQVGVLLEMVYIKETGKHFQIRLKTWLKDSPCRVWAVQEW